jgi:hypothetical protein
VKNIRRFGAEASSEQPFPQRIRFAFASQRRLERVKIKSIKD